LHELKIEALGSYDASLGPSTVAHIGNALLREGVCSQKLWKSIGTVKAVGCKHSLVHIGRCMRVTTGGNERS
jgi:hypothetical protein